MKSEKDQFDKIIQEKLSDLEAPYSAPDWDRMEELLDEEEFDRVAADKLRRVEPAYDPGSWDLMARRIDEAFSFRHWLHRNHVPELALMILLGFTLIEYFVLDVSTPQPPPAGEIERKISPVGEMERGISPSGEIGRDVPSAVWEVYQSPERSTPQPPPAGEIGREISPAGEMEGETPPAPPQASVVPEASVAPRAVIAAAAPSLIHTSFFSEGEIPDLEPFAHGSALAGIEAFKAIVRKPARMYLSLYSGSDFALVHTPADEAFGTPGYWEDTVAYAAGLSFTLEGRKWSLLTGLNYSRVAYRPLVPVQMYGTFDYLVVESFEGIQNQFLNIPLQLRRGFLPIRSGWDVYLLAGMEANLLLDGRYQISREVIESSRSMAPEPNAAELSLLSEKTFPKGLLNGGNLGDNAYLSFSGGFGIERKIGDRLQVFAESVYSRPFFGHHIGPNMDQIHRVSMRIGGKVRIK
jgi:hypothetical protein